MWTAAFLAVVLACLAESTLAGTEDHPCKRECVANSNMKCQYNFTMEWYRVLSKACYDCPSNITDCYREECIAGDGNPRLVVAVNRQVPGPAIEVCEGDEVEVRLTNMLEDGLSTSMHWHGQHVLNEGYYDGAGGITQCNIQGQETFVYKLHAHPAGTHWYHGHTGLQLADGQFGPFIVRQAPGLDPNDHLYDSEHIVMVYNWYPDIALKIVLDTNLDRPDFTLPQTIMTNGRGRAKDAKTPLEVLLMEQGKRYRLRFISAAPACPLQISVDQHELTVISADGVPVEPRVADAFIINPGERYDLVLTADKPVANYWMRLIGLGECESAGITGAAIIRYQGAPEEDPAGDPSQQRDGVLLNYIPHDGDNPAYGLNRDVIATDELRDAAETDYTNEQVDHKFIIGMDLNRNDNTKYNNKDLYPVQTLPREKAHLTPVIDNITFSAPPVPLMSQKEDVDGAWFCNRSSLEDPDYCQNTDLCMCTHTLAVKLNTLVELIVFHEGRFIPEPGHAMHLHGHNFHLLGMEKVGPSLSRAKVEEMDRLGQLKRNLIRPPVRDTVNVPDGGYIILRFRANNPGFWFFHCHTDAHLHLGMALLFKVGEYSDFPPMPDEFPRCGGMGFSNADRRPSAGQSIEPDNPANPVNPNNPDKPVNPNNPAKPVNPNNPVKPANPGNPVNPVYPGGPGYPGRPIHPFRPHTQCSGSRRPWWCNWNHRP